MKFFKSKEFKQLDTVLKVLNRDRRLWPKILATLRRRSSNRISFLSILEFLEKIMGFSGFPQNYHKKTRKTRIFPISPMLKIFLVFQNSFFWFLWVSDRPQVVDIDPSYLKLDFEFYLSWLQVGFGLITARSSFVPNSMSLATTFNLDRLALLIKKFFLRQSILKAQKAFNELPDPRRHFLCNLRIKKWPLPKEVRGIYKRAEE